MLKFFVLQLSQYYAQHNRLERRCGYSSSRKYILKVWEISCICIL